MKKFILIAVVMLAAGAANGTIVSLDLFDLGCPGLYDFDTPYWTSDYDLGVTFSSISSVSIDWSGEITGGMVSQSSVNGGVPFPADVGLLASLGFDPFRHVDIWAGAATYPESESFSGQYEFLLANWNDLLDGTGTIYLDYSEYMIGDGGYTEHGSVTLDSAVLIVDGTIIPEPVTLCLFGLGVIGVCKRNRR